MNDMSTSYANTNLDESSLNFAASTSGICEADVSGFTMADVNFWIPRMAFSEAHQHRATHVKGGEKSFVGEGRGIYIYI